MVADKIGELESRRLAFIEACAYYIRLKGINGDLDRLVMTMELAELITERYKMKQLFWAISGFKSYEQLLADGMAETGKLPDFEGSSLEKSMVHEYNFRSMVAGEIRNKEMLCNASKSKHSGQPAPLPTSLHTSNRLFQMAVASATASAATTPTTPDETVAKTAPAPPTPTEMTPTKTAPISAPHDILKGFTVFIKPDVHLDETIPICARDQHLLYNIFGEKWTAPVVISAYTAIKGQTGFMHNWSNGEDHHT